ncbi:hypothetical protein NEOLI_004783 [Neolecta irregularis DAH-3]|uniref:Uncharacterized protein n=1 Tax=Neolecta irregularis (strain DAH-3) TaxID=1198029 RepID=A0A1U7LM54_NEOID|nr:hypothetical protein NEOLI_004783 [Neolecta irregularis DAH-3]|eukprot:OLL23727.1 hypothetical protein NEOLI_004783 [Neolecta irregularis DAH-3]
MHRAISHNILPSILEYLDINSIQNLVGVNRSVYLYVCTFWNPKVVRFSSLDVACRHKLTDDIICTILDNEMSWLSRVIRRSRKIDLSGTLVSISSIEKILKQHPRLQHLVLSRLINAPESAIIAMFKSTPFSQSITLNLGPSVRNFKFQSSHVKVSELETIQSPLLKVNRYLCVDEHTGASNVVVNCPVVKGQSPSKICNGCMTATTGPTTLLDAKHLCSSCTSKAPCSHCSKQYPRYKTLPCFACEKICCRACMKVSCFFCKNVYCGDCFTHTSTSMASACHWNSKCKDQKDRIVKGIYMFPVGGFTSVSGVFFGIGYENMILETVL